MKCEVCRLALQEHLLYKVLEIESGDDIMLFVSYTLRTDTREVPRTLKVLLSTGSMPQGQHKTPQWREEHEIEDRKPVLYAVL